MESVEQIKEFNKYLIGLALLKEYKVRRLDTEASIQPESSRNIPYGQEKTDEAMKTFPNQTG